MLSFNYSNIDKRNKRVFNHSSIDKVFLEGPPFISGKKTKYSGLHMGHALISYIKSTLMNYYNCKPWTGSDNHGLPTEMLVMDYLNLKTPKDIEEYGIGAFNDKCKEIINEYENKWDPIYDAIGREYNKEYRYKTCSYEFMSCIWRVFNKLYNENTIYSGVKILPYDISAKCCLSNFEANQEYKNINTNSYYIKFKLVDEDKYLIIWTTTLWTIPGNKGVCVNKNGNYVIINNKYIMSMNYVMNVSDCISIKNKRMSTIHSIDINNYINKYYYNMNGEKCKIVSDDYVDYLNKDNSQGTGLVHLCPFFGEDDYRVCIDNNIIKKEDIMKDIIIDDEGNYTIDEYKGKNIFDKDVEKDIIEKLKEKDMLMKTKQINHSYPFSPRTHKPLIYKACHSYFVKVEDIKETLINNINLTNWNNENAKNRMIKWLENAKDWCISRNRYFGTPIPIFINDNGEEVIVNDEYFGDDLHPEYMRDITINGKPYKWCGEVFDCWFESGCVGIYSMSKNGSGKYLSDFVIEGIEQTTNWFYVLLIISHLYNNTIPYRNVVCCGLICGKDGKKFSKSSGNYVAPEEIIEKYGSDSIRMYLLDSKTMEGSNMIFNENNIKDYKSKLIQYYNSIVYFIEYYNYYGKALNKCESNNVFDCWIVKRVEDIIEKVNDNMNNYFIKPNIQLLLSFIEDFTNYYIKFNRNRINGSCYENEQNTSLSVMYYVIKRFNEVLKIFCPFSSDEIDEVISKVNYEGVSVNNIDMKKMEMFKDIVIGIRRCRMNSKKFSSIKKCVRIIKIYYCSDIDIDEFVEYIKDECNCLSLEIFKNCAFEYEYDIKVDFDNIDKKECKKYINMLKNEREEIIRENMRGFIINKKIKIDKECGMFIDCYDNVKIKISMDENEDMKNIDMIREVINEIQMKRKEEGLHIYDKIIVHMKREYEEYDEMLKKGLKCCVMYDCDDLFTIERL